MIREIYTRFGREGLGFAWIVAEPLVFAIPVSVAVVGAVRDPNEHGLSLMPFLWSGYLAAIAFPSSRRPHVVVHTCRTAGCSTISGSRFSTFFSHAALLEIFSNLTALWHPCVFYAIGAWIVPRDLPMFYLGYFYMIWWSVAVALIIGALSERTDWVATDLDALLLPVHVLLGFFYLADWLPPTPPQR